MGRMITKINIFKTNCGFVYTDEEYFAINSRKNLKNLVEIVFKKVKETKWKEGEEIRIFFPKETFIEYKRPKNTKLFLPLTIWEVKKFWGYYKKLAGVL